MRRYIINRVEEEDHLSWSSSREKQKVLQLISRELNVCDVRADSEKVHQLTENGTNNLREHKNIFVKFKLLEAKCFFSFFPLCKIIHCH